MRNCLDTHVADCAGGRMEIDSIRDVVTGKRRACAGSHYDENGWPPLTDVKGFANTPPKGGIIHIAHRHPRYAYCRIKDF